MFSYLFRRLRYLWQFIPLTSNTLLVGLAIWLAYHYLFGRKPAAGTEESASSFLPFILLMGQLLFWFLLALLALSLLSTLAAWLWYLLRRHSGKAKLQLDFTNELKSRRGRSRLFVHAALPGAFRPLLGFVKGRLFYDDYLLSGKFPLLGSRPARGRFFRSAIAGKSRLLLPDIREYQLRGAFVFFEDMLRLISLPVREASSAQFYQPPMLVRQEEKAMQPKKTESMDVRIDEMRRVEGELLNYKDFEAGDDVRRIVWKVYAKNRDLVVRTPEMFEPYASHLYFYASFYASLPSGWLDSPFLAEMLNYYKNRVWTVYDALSRKEWEMRYIPDQHTTLPETLSATEKAARTISASRWQQDHPLLQYFNTRQGAVLCVASLCDPQELRQTLEQCGPGTIVYYVPLSKTFRHLILWGWFKRLIFLPPKDRLNRLRTRWTFSPLKYQLKSRERVIEKVLEDARVTVGKV